MNVADLQGRMPLHSVALYGRTEILYLLVDNGAKVNAVDGDDRTALHLVACAWFGLNRSGMVKKLLAAGVNVNAIDGYGWTALHTAAEYKHV